MSYFRFPTRRLPWALAAALLSACTATEQSAESAVPRGAVPTEVRTDADRRAIYNSGSGSGSTGSAVPDASPNRVRLGEQASDINRGKRLESVNSNDANNTTPETRLQRLGHDLPADTLRRP